MPLSLVLSALLMAQAGQSVIAAAALSDHIGAIFGVGSKEQVIGSDAGRIIATVTNQETVRNRAIVDYPREAVCSPHTNAGAQCSIASRSGGGPNPAARPLLCHLPETGDGIWGKVGISHGDSSKSLWLGSRLGVTAPPSPDYIYASHTGQLQSVDINGLAQALAHGAA